MTTISGAYAPATLVDAIATRKNYEVTDTAANISDASNWAALFSVNSPVTKLTVSGTNPSMTVSSAQYQTAIQNSPQLIAKSFKTGSGIGSGTSDFTNLTVQNVDAAMLAKVSGDKHVAKMTVVMAGDALSGSIKSLLTSNKIEAAGITVTGSKPVMLTHSQFMEYGGNTDGSIKAGSALTKFAGTSAIFSITGATVQQADALKTGARIAKISVADTGANIAAGLSGLNALSKLSEIKQTDSLKPIELTAASYHTAATAGTMAKLASNVKLSIDATAAGTNIGTLATTLSANGNTFAKLKLATASTANLTYDQYKGVRNVMVDATGKSRNYAVEVSGANVEQALGILSDTNITKIAVTANATNFSSAANAEKLFTVLSSAKVDAGSVTNSSISAAPISLSFAQFTEARWGGIAGSGAIAASTTAGTAVLNKFATAVSFNVTGASITQADLVKGGAKIASLSVTDTAANIGLAANITKLAAMTKLTAIKQSDTATIAMTATDYLANQATLATLGASSKLSITATAAEVDDIIARATTENDTLAKITVSDSGTAALTYAQYQKYGDLIYTTAGNQNYKTDISGATAQRAGGLLVNNRVEKITVSEAKTSLLSSQNTKDILGLLGNVKTTAITFTGTGSTPSIGLAYDDFIRLGGKSDGTVDATRTTGSVSAATALSKLEVDVTFSVTGASVDQAKALSVAGSRVVKMAVNDSGSNIASKITDLTALGSKLISIQQKDRGSMPVAMSFAAYSTAATAGTMAKLAISSKLSITAAAADISGTSGLLKLAETAKNTLLKITVSDSDTAPVSLSNSQYKALGDKIFDKTGVTQNFTANVAASFSQAKELLNDARVVKVSIADSVANAVGADASLMAELAANSKVEMALSAAANNDVQNDTSPYSLAKLNALGGRLKTISGSGIATTGNPLSLSLSQLGQYRDTLAKINSDSYKVNLSGDQTLAMANAILGSEATSLHSHVQQLSIKTTQTNIQASLDTLMGYAGAGKLSKISDSAGNNVSLAVTATQYNNSNFGALKTALTAGLATGKTLSFSVSGVSAASAKTVGDDAAVSTLNVTDTASAIASNLAKLAGAGSKLGTLTQSDAATIAPALTVSDYERQNTYATVLGKINTANSAYTMTVTNVSAATAAARSATSNVSGIVINDTNAAIGSNLAAIAGIAPSKLLSVGKPMTSSAMSSSLTSGTISGTAAIATGDLYINGENIGALSAATSVANRLADLVSAINAKTGSTGVAASADTASSYKLTAADGRAISITSNNTALQTSVSGFAAKDAVAGAGGTAVTSLLPATVTGDLYINGVVIDALGAATSGANRLTDLVSAINAKTGTSGVTASISSATGYQLASADGRAITVTSDNSTLQTDVSGFAVKGATAGAGGTSVTSGAIELTAAQYKTSILTPTSAPASSSAAYAYSGGAMSINTNVIAAATNDGVSYVAGVKSAATGATSALAVKTAINAVTAHNVTAVASTAVTSGVISSWDTMAAGDVYINGQDIGALAAASTAAARVTQLVAAINTKTGTTGVTAAANNDATYTLTAADGRNIDITSNNAASQLSKSGFAVEDAANGAGGTAATYYGKLTLTASAAFTIAGDVTGSGLAAATYAEKRTEGSTATANFNPGLIGKLDNLTLTAVSAEDAEDLKGKANIKQFKVSDSGQNVLLNAANLKNNAKISAGDIELTGTNPVISMAYGTATTDTSPTYMSADAQGALAKIATGSRYQIALSDMTAAEATNSALAFKSDAHVATVSVSDTESNVLANLTALKALGDTLSTLKISGTATPNLSLTESQYSSNTTLLSKINGLRLQVTGVSAANAGTVASNASVVGLTVSDTGDNIEAQFASLNSLAGSASTSGVAANGATYATGESRINVAGKLTAITRTDSAPIDILAATYADGSTALQVLLAAKTINVTGLDVATAVDITSNDASGSEVAWNSTATGTKDIYDQKVLVSVKDTAANIEADLGATTSKLAAIDTLGQLGTLQATGTNVKVNISGATYLAETFKDLLPNLVDGITVSDVTAANFAAGKPNAVSDVNVSKFAFKDTAANIVSVLDKLDLGRTTGKLTEIRESETTSTPLPVTLTQVTNYLATLALVQDSTGTTKPGLNVTT